MAILVACRFLHNLFPPQGVVKFLEYCLLLIHLSLRIQCARIVYIPFIVLLITLLVVVLVDCVSLTVQCVRTSEK